MLNVKFFGIWKELQETLRIKVFEKTYKVIIFLDFSKIMRKFQELKNTVDWEKKV